MRIPGRGSSSCSSCSSSSSSSSLSRMRHEFLRRWLKGLEIYSGSGRKKEMNILERKNAIKLSADVAMASTRIGTTYCWSRALIAKASKDATGNNILVQHINNYLVKSSSSSPDDHDDDHDQDRNNNRDRDQNRKEKKIGCRRIMRSKKKLLRRVNKIKKRSLSSSSSIVIAKNLVKKRTKLLKSLVPGGELMDEVSLIRETLDYIVSLRLQVELMRHLANATVLQLDHDEQQK